VRYSVSVKFSEDGRLQVVGNEITISIKSPPERGRANAELVQLLSAYFGVEPFRVRIVSGMKSRKKIVEVF
jgi:uncharacterized protein